MSAEPRLILASASPRRHALLTALGLPFRAETSQVPEVRRPKEAPPAYARRLAAEKASAVADRNDGALPVLAADTVVCLGDRVLEKPESAEAAVETLTALSGRTHRVVTGVAVSFAGTVHQQAVITEVRFRTLTPAEIAWYVGTGEPMDKAGAYAIQGTGSFLIEAIDGSPSNVVGLPLAETLDLLRGVGLRLPWES
jgi:septum formation protein